MEHQVNGQIDILLCDDEQIWIDLLEKGIQKWVTTNRRNVMVHTFTTGADLISYCNDGGKADVLFLDLVLGDGVDGINVAKELRSHACTAEIVIVTNQSLRANERFSIDATFLLKEYTFDDLAHILDSLLSNHNPADKFIFFKKQNELVQIEKNKIVYAEVYDHDAIIHTIFLCATYNA